MRANKERTAVAVVGLLIACSSNRDEPADATIASGGTPSATGGAATAGTGGSAGTPTMTGGTAGTPTTTGGTAGMPTPVGGMTGTTGGTAGMPSVTGGTAGTPATSGGTAGAPPATSGGTSAGGLGGADGGGGTPPTAPVPKIPEYTGECPSFSSGRTTILGMTATIEAGTPGPVQGALVFGFHGTAGLGAGDLPSSVKSELTSEGGMLIRPTYNTRTYAAETDIAIGTNTWFVSDMEWVDRVTACAVKEHNIDPNRIYATGCSAGGLMAGSLGLMRSEYIAAVAPNSGGINQPGSRKLSSDRGPAAFLMHGGAGDNVIINFQQSSGWFEDANKQAATLPYMLDCNHGIGHCGAPASLFQVAWEFFKAHPFNVVDSPWKASPPADLPNYCEVVE